MKKNYAKSFKALVESEGYVMVGQYIHSSKKIELLCPEGHSYSVKPNAFKNGSRCTKCLSPSQIKFRNTFFDLLKQEKYILKSEYINGTTKVLLECPEGHDWTVAPCGFKKGTRCPKCPRPTTKRVENEFMEYLADRGYTLKSTYSNSKVKVMLLCPNGHEWKVRPKEFKKGQQCPKCLKRCPDQAKEEFLNLIEKEGYILKSEYITSNKKVTLQCPVGHEFDIKPIIFKRGVRCSKCYKNCPIQSEKDFIKTVQERKYKLKGKYKNSMTKVALECPEGHDWSVIPASFKRGINCPVCSGSCPIQAEKDFKELLIKEGYTLKGQYVNTSTGVSVICPNGHDWKAVPNNFKFQYQRCSHCAGSSGQRRLQKMLEGYDFGSAIYNDRKILDGLELDIYFPDISVAIEFQGIYWHSLDRVKKNDARKRMECKIKGIHLIEVLEQDFNASPLIETDRVVEEIEYIILKGT